MNANMFGPDNASMHGDIKLFGTWLSALLLRIGERQILKSPDGIKFILYLLDNQLLAKIQRNKRSKSDKIQRNRV